MQFWLSERVCMEFITGTTDGILKIFSPRKLEHARLAKAKLYPGKFQSF